MPKPSRVTIFLQPTQTPIFVSPGGVRGVGCVYSKLLNFPHTVSYDLMHVTDWLPTLVHVAGGSLPQTYNLDGMNLWATLQVWKFLFGCTAPERFAFRWNPWGQGGIKSQHFVPPLKKNPKTFITFQQHSNSSWYSVLWGEHRRKFEPQYGKVRKSVFTIK